MAILVCLNLQKGELAVDSHTYSSNIDMELNADIAEVGEHNNSGQQMF
jgi:hypothetical protein